ncbi:MAG TPA: ABC-type transport auxiliary lipoprotein family protein, partial [Stellaceae bacterium]|nr:ABC-type transport auxiliary lipoprotein family protein [Stellaceae bacterium]
PLDEQIRRVLSEDLTARLPGRVIGPTAPSVPPGTRLVAVDIERFDADQRGQVVLSADWSLVADNRALQRHAERIEIAATGTQPADAPPAMSRAIGLLADRIAAQLRGGADH